MQKNVVFFLIWGYWSPISPKAYTIIPWIYSVEMDWALQISIQNITLPLHSNAVVIF